MGLPGQGHSGAPPSAGQRPCKGTGEHRGDRGLWVSLVPPWMTDGLAAMG